MKRVFSRKRFALALLCVSAFLIASFFTIGETTNSAQERTGEPPKAKYEHFSKADAITSDIRDRSKELVRVQFDTIEERESVTRYGRIVEDFGSWVVLSKKKEIDL